MESTVLGRLALRGPLVAPYRSRSADGPPSGAASQLLDDLCAEVRRYAALRSHCSRRRAKREPGTWRRTESRWHRSDQDAVGTGTVRLQRYSALSPAGRVGGSVPGPFVEVAGGSCTSLPCGAGCLRPGPEPLLRVCCPTLVDGAEAIGVVDLVLRSETLPDVQDRPTAGPSRKASNEPPCGSRIIHRRWEVREQDRAKPGGSDRVRLCGPRGTLVRSRSRLAVDRARVRFAGSSSRSGADPPGGVHRSGMLVRLLATTRRKIEGWGWVRCCAASRALRSDRARLPRG